MIAYVYWVGVALGSLGVLAAFLVCLLGIQRMAWFLLKELYGWSVLYKILREHHARNRKGEEA